MIPERKIFPIDTNFSDFEENSGAKEDDKSINSHDSEGEDPLIVNILQMKTKKAAEAKCHKLGQENSSLGLFGKWQVVLHQVVFHFQHHWSKGTYCRI